MSIATGVYLLLVLEHPCAFRICRDIYRIWELHAHAYDIIMHTPMISFIDAINSIMLGKVFSISQQYYKNELIYILYFFHCHK